MAASVQNNILNAMATMITALSLVDQNGDDVTVSVQKLPKAEETIDTLPVLCVVPSEKPEQIEQWSFEGDAKVGYTVQVVAIQAGQSQMILGLDTILSWREIVRQLFGARQIPTVSSVYDVWIEMETIIDREKLNQDYDYTGMAFVVWSNEIITG
jgi:hypothetical protein